MMLLKRSRFLIFGIFALLVTHGWAEQRTNVLFILADDAGYHDFGFQDHPGLEKLTPNLDQLAKDGARFTDALANASMCAPSRAALLTGRYPHRFGFQQNYPESTSLLFEPLWSGDGWEQIGLPLEEKTIADHLQTVGYQTALIGKWHLGYADAFHPNRRGFDFFWGLRGGSRPYFGSPELESAPPPKKFDQIEAGWELVPEASLDYVTDDFTDAADAYIRENRDQPFFLMVSYTAPHTPMQGRDEDLAWVKEHFPGLDPKREQNLAMVRALDRGVGQLRATLKELGLAENTVVIFTVDNGGSIRSLADNSPLRGFKYSPFEGGLRVPLLVDWPGITKPGMVIREPVMLCDLAPTFLAAAGASPEQIPSEFDGASLLPLIRGEKSPIDGRQLFWREINSAGPTSIVREGPYKLIQYSNRPAELYNVDADPGETENLAQKEPERVHRLADAFAAWSANLPPPRWFQF